jgi:hypothetical protein
MWCLQINKLISDQLFQWRNPLLPQLLPKGMKLWRTFLIVVQMLLQKGTQQKKKFIHRKEKKTTLMTCKLSMENLKQMRLEEEEKNS